MVQGFIARRALAHVGVASILRRGLTVAPRLFLGLLPLLLVAYAPIVVAFVLFGPSTLVSQHVAVWEDAGEALAERYTLAIEASLAGWSILVSPWVAAAATRSAIRAAFGERVRFRAVLVESWRAAPRALPAALLAGLLTTVGFGLLVVPGFVAAAWLFPLGAVAAVERRGLGATFARTAELTRGTRWPLIGAAFVLGFVERFVFRFVSFLAPRTLYSSEGASDLWLFLGIAVVSSLALTTWRAAAAATAYDELRVRADRLEIDGVVREIGGQAVIGVEIGAEAATSSRIGTMQRRRKGLVWLIVSAAVLALVTFVAAPFAGDWWKERQQRATWEREDRERQAQAREAASQWAKERELRERERDASAPGSPVPGGEDIVPPAAAAEPEENNEALAARVRAASGEARRTLLGKDVAKRATELWGPGFAGALRQLAKVSEADLELAVVPALGQEAQASGCGDAFKKSREAEPEAQSARFAKGCPPPAERRAIEPKRLRQVPLWAGALAVLLELRARDRSMTDEPLHRAVIEALVAERVP
jgi:hypothetical protein